MKTTLFLINSVFIGSLAWIGRANTQSPARRKDVICLMDLQIKEIDEYFPPKKRRKLLDKWKEVLEKLHQEGKIRLQPSLNLSRLANLLRYRHGLIHASASRPATKTQSPKTKPFPRKEDLKALKAGWALSIVTDLVSELCDQLGEPKPEYLQKP